MKQIIIFLFLLVSILPYIVYGSTDCVQEESCTIYGICKNTTYANSTARILIYLPNSTLLINDSMTEISIGKFNYTFISPDVTGNYLQILECSIGGFTGYGEDNIIIGESKMIANEMFQIGRILIIIFWVLLSTSMVYFGLRNRIRELSFIGGTLGVICGFSAIFMLSSYFGAIGISFFIVFIILSLGVMFI